MKPQTWFQHLRIPQTWNLNAHFIAPNPSTSFNPEPVCPDIHRTAYVGPFSSIIGNVTVDKNVFIAPLVSVRADEGAPFYIGENTNLQDGVILHGLEHGRVKVDGREFSIYIGRRVSCAHGSLIHGPCRLGDNTFVGFNAIVFNAIVGNGCYISIGALVTGGIRIPEGRFVPPFVMVDTQEEADALPPVPQSQEEFAREVIHVNTEFPGAYSMMFGPTRCSCGITCHPDDVKRLLDD
jgi:carbonic anhydrase/acetyltransferase-like protein (isoleucine patch superfamily)